MSYRGAAEDCGGAGSRVCRSPRDKIHKETRLFGGAEAEVTPLIVPCNIPEASGIVGWKTVNKKGDRTTVFSFIRIPFFCFDTFWPARFRNSCEKYMLNSYKHE